MPIIAPIPLTERRLMQKTIYNTRDKKHARRLIAMLMLHRGERVSVVARMLCCARSSVWRWINWFTSYGLEGLESLPAGRGRRWPFEQICALLKRLVERSPGDFGYQRSRWSTELLAIKINQIVDCPLFVGRIKKAQRHEAEPHHTLTRPDAWREWDKAAGLAATALEGQIFDHFYFSLQAAVAGLSVAIGSWYQVCDDLESGVLAAPQGFTEDGSRYYLLSPEPFVPGSLQAELLAWLRSLIEPQPS